MSDPKLFRADEHGVMELKSKSIDLEKSLQTVIEKNLETMLGVRVLGSEYVTGKTHGGRIDTLGIDENSCPVIIEYKRTLNENVINQGLFYLDWLLDHKAEVKLLVLDKYGRKEADEINWTGTRLLCIAADFTRYDEHAVQQINRNIELIRYRRFGEDLLLLELANAVSAKTADAKIVKTEEKHAVEWTWDQEIAKMTPPLPDLFETLRAFLLALGDDVQEKRLSLYIAFKRLKNFVCVELRKDKLMLYVKLNPDSVVPLESGFSRDVRDIGHWGTGDLELTVQNEGHLRKTKDLLVRSYEEN
jgi:predicted transport protein